MRQSFLLALLLANIFCLQPAVMQAQESNSTGREIVKKVLPVYPSVAKHMGLGGVVKVDVTIDPKGNVKSTKVVGGSPVLANAAEDAIRRWQFQPGPDTTTQMVEFKFDPQQ